jgi:hypothetical protein
LDEEIGMKAITTGFAMLAAVALAGSAHAAIGTWTVDAAKQVAGMTVTGSGNSATWTGTTTIANGAVVAPLDPITLTPGTYIDLHGTMAIPAGITDLGNLQLRFGLFNVNGNNPLTTSTGWTGYMPEVPNGGAGVIRADDPTTNMAWANSAAGQLVTVVNTGTNNKGGPNGPYTFDLMITETAVGTQVISSSFISSDGATYVWNATGTDSAPAAAANSTYNELGFFDGATGMGTAPTVTFSNVTVTTGLATPEPASLGVIGLGVVGLLARRRR